MPKTQKPKPENDLDTIIMTLGFLPGKITTQQINALESAIKLKKEKK